MRSDGTSREFDPDHDQQHGHDQSGHQVHPAVPEGVLPVPRPAEPVDAEDHDRAAEHVEEAVRGIRHQGDAAQGQPEDELHQEDAGIHTNARPTLQQAQPRLALHLGTPPPRALEQLIGDDWICSTHSDCAYS